MVLTSSWAKSAKPGPMALCGRLWRPLCAAPLARLAQSPRPSQSARRLSRRSAGARMSGQVSCPSLRPGTSWPLLPAPVCISPAPGALGVVHPSSFMSCNSSAPSAAVICAPTPMMLAVLAQLGSCFQPLSFVSLPHPSTPRTQGRPAAYPGSQSPSLALSPAPAGPVRRQASRVEGRYQAGRDHVPARFSKRPWQRRCLEKMDSGGQRGASAGQL